MTQPRIVSLLPAATEMACLLGLEDSVVGISFECDYPHSITNRPRVVNAVVDTRTLTPREIEDAVNAQIRDGQSLYTVDDTLLRNLRPDIILTQDLCRVCASDGNDLANAVRNLDYSPQIIFMTPHSLADIESNLLELAEATGTTAKAKAIIADWHRRLDAVQKRVAALPRPPRIFLMEWVDPIYCSGHWLPEMTKLAGGVDKLAKPGVDSVRMEWQQIIDWQPEILVVAPCGYNKEQAAAQIPYLTTLPGWETLPAVQNGRVYPVDANAYFVRPGPRIIDGIEILADIFNPSPLMGRE